MHPWFSEKKKKRKKKSPFMKLKSLRMTQTVPHLFFENFVILAYTRMVMFLCLDE